MHAVMQTARPEGGPERDVDLLIEKGFLLLGSMEHQINEHLMSHGTRIDPETRFFMSQMRDAAGDTATKMLDEARNQLETAPGAGAPERPQAEVPGARPVDGSLLLAEGESPATGSPGGRQSIAFGRTAATVGLGTAMAAAAALLVTVWAASVRQVEFAGGTDASGAEELAVMATTSEASAAGSIGAVAIPPTIQVNDEKTGSAGGASTYSVVRPVQDEVRSNSLRPRTQVGDVGRSEAAGYRQLAETLAIATHAGKPGTQPPYPDPRAGPEQTAPNGEQAAAAAEQRLALSTGIRREVQRRLALARFDPQHFDGIFGPATRAALGEWQRQAGIPATGYLNASALALLRDRTAEDYRAMQATNKARARKQETRMVLTSPIPQVSPLRADRCSRTRTGKIVYGRSVRCDFRGLRQSIAGIFG